VFYHRMIVMHIAAHTVAGGHAHAAFAVVGCAWSPNQGRYNTSSKNRACRKQKRVTYMMPKIDFNHLLQQEEGEKFDFKRQLDIRDEKEKSKFVKDIISMANTLGDEPAFILIGVDNKGAREAVGVTAHHDDATLQEIVKAKVNPVPRFSYRPLSYSGKSFGLLRIESDHRLHQATQDYGVLRKHTIYLRRGSSNQEADAAEIELLVHDKSSRAFGALLKQQAWARGSPPPSPRLPEAAWTPGWTFNETVAAPIPPSSPLSVGMWLVVRLRQLPSNYWRDPVVGRIYGVYDDATGTATRLSNQVVVRCTDGSEVNTSHLPLCIPSYDVDVEWRDESYIADPVWGSAKAILVRRFLKACLSVRLLCRIVYIGQNDRRAQFHLNSPDYDQYLTEHWARFKGIENALAKSKLYKQSVIGEVSEQDLRTIVKNDLIAKGVIQEMLPPRFRDVWANQSPETDTVLLVLRGLIQRYARLQERRRKLQKSKRR
jgi:hypothetical protein